MRKQEDSNALFSVRIGWVAAIAAAVTITGVAITLSPRHAQATPAYAAQTKLPCGRCHVNPAGGGPETEFGKDFAANGHKLPLPKKQ